MSDRLQQLLHFLKEDPNDGFLRFALAKEYEKQEDFDNALKFYLELYNAQPDYIGLYLHLGGLYEKLSDSSNAMRIYSEGLVVAKNLNDFHAASELNTAKMNLDTSID